MGGGTNNGAGVCATSGTGKGACTCTDNADTNGTTNGTGNGNNGGAIIGPINGTINSTNNGPRSGIIQGTRVASLGREGCVGRGWLRSPGLPPALCRAGCAEAQVVCMGLAHRQC